MLVLDKEKLAEQAKQSIFILTEKIIEICEALFPVIISAYYQGKESKDFDILPVKEVTL